MDGKRHGRRNRGSAAVVAVALVAAALATAAARDAPAAAASSLRGWTRLQLGASKLLVASARSVIERWPPESADARGGVRVTTTTSYLGRTRVHHAFSAWVGAGRASRWMELDPGKRAKETTVRADGSLLLRRFGVPEGARPPWTGRWREAEPLAAPVSPAADAAGCAGPVDPWGLLGRLECLIEAPEVRVWLLSKDGGYAVVARRVGARRGALSLADLDGGSPRTFETDQVRVELTPAAGGSAPSLFGMEGPITLWIDAASGALVEISGKREGIPGLIRFRLTGAAWAARPAPEFPWPSEADSALAAPAP